MSPTLKPVASGLEKFEVETSDEGAGGERNASGGVPV